MLLNLILLLVLHIDLHLKSEVKACWQGRVASYFIYPSFHLFACGSVQPLDIVAPPNQVTKQKHSEGLGFRSLIGRHIGEVTDNKYGKLLAFFHILLNRVKDLMNDRMGFFLLPAGPGSAVQVKAGLVHVYPELWAYRFLSLY